MTALSEAERIGKLNAAGRQAVLGKLNPAQRIELAHDWRHHGRPSQHAPAGRWRTWLMMAGRGFGKTRAGAEWVRALAEADSALRVALVGATRAEARGVMVEGPSGLLAICPPESRPLWEPSLGRLSWPNGAEARIYSAAEPDSLRGPQHGAAWADEIAKWPHGVAAWDNLQMGLRLGDDPRALATTTPRPVPLVRRLAREKGVKVTGGRTRDNRRNLAPGFVAAMEAAHGGTRWGRQELCGELIDEVAGALWTRAQLEACRVAEVAPPLRVVVGVDPPATSGGDACGIVAVQLGRDQRAAVLEDASVTRPSPQRWAAAVAACARRHAADRVVAEGNNGGEMVESVLRAAAHALPIRRVHASHGKAARAEPVAALYESGRVAHLGCFPALEDEMAGIVAGGRYEGPGRSPDRADALVWALTELMLGPGGAPALRML